MHRPKNVGCFLQTFGLQEAIQKRGYDCEIIDYYYPNAFHKQLTIKTKLAKLINKPLKHLFGGNSFKVSDQRFWDCINHELNLSKKNFKTPEELYQNPPDYDLYCVGSDQVWNPNFIHADPSFFCDFAPEEKPVVSFASSFGVSTIPQVYKEQYKKYLSRFKMLGVREVSGVHIVKELTGKDAELVLDPTLLLTSEEWLKIASGHTINHPEPYILCYGGPYPNTYGEQLALHIQKKTGLKIVHLFGRPWQKLSRKIQYIYDVGPWEFLNWINNAALVLTTSFHGTIYSINFKRPFYSVYLNAERGSRQLNILKCLDLESRAIMAGAQFPEVDFLDVDFDAAHKNLKNMTEKSFIYLEKMLAVGDNL